MLILLDSDAGLHQCKSDLSLRSCFQKDPVQLLSDARGTLLTLEKTSFRPDLLSLDYQQYLADEE